MSISNNSIKEILEKQNQDVKILFDDYKIEIENYFKKIIEENNKLKIQLKEKDEQIDKLNNQIKDNDFNNQNYQNFSLVSNLSKQIRDKDLELKTCQSQLRIAKKEIDGLKEKIEVMSEKDEIETIANIQFYVKEQVELINNTEKENEINVQLEVKEIEQTIENESDEKEDSKEESEDEADEAEISYVRKKIKGTYYFISDENPPKIYEYINDNDVGPLLGKMNDKKAEFF
jgi:hypothetical protein